VKSAEFVPIATARPAVVPAPDAEPVAAVSSNVGLPESRSFLIVVDIEQIDSGGGRVGMRAVSDFVSALGPDDRVGAVALPYGRPRVDLTTNRTLLKQTLGLIVGASQRRDDSMSAGEAFYIDKGDRSVVDKWKARHGAAPCSPSDATCLMNAQRAARPVLDDERRRSRILLDTLRALCEAMKPLSGLKTIVLISEGMVSDRDFGSALRGAYRGRDSTGGLSSVSFRNTMLSITSPSRISARTSWPPIRRPKTV
jgi:hypothetical protein